MMVMVELILSKKPKLIQFESLLLSILFTCAQAEGTSHNLRRVFFFLLVPRP